MNSRKAALNILYRWKKENKIIDFLFETETANVDEKDKKFIYFLVFGVIEKWLTLEVILGKISNNQLNKNKLDVRIALFAASYEILFSNQKHYAIVNEYVNSVKKKSAFAGKIVNAILRTIVNQKHELLEELEFSENIEFKYNIPVELHSLLLKNYKNSDLLSWYKKLSTEKNTIWLRKKILSNDLKLKRFKRVENLADVMNDIKSGSYSVQDISAGKVVEYMSPLKKTKILDFCSAPGSKSCYIAELTEDEAEIVASDINSFRLEKVKNSVERLGLKSIKVIEQDELLAMKQSFDQILLDVPCTGSGTLFKNSDIKFRISRNKIKELNEIQLGILHQVLPLLKLGGEIIYSSCSIFPEENELLIGKFLEKNNGIEIKEKSKTILPFTGEYDGSFMIKLKKTKEE